MQRVVDADTHTAVAMLGGMGDIGRSLRRVPLRDREVLGRIEQIRMQKPMIEKLSSMVILGHSFGGAAVFSAVSHYIETNAIVAWQEARLTSTATPPTIGKIHGFGDLVVLVNPAFE